MLQTIYLLGPYLPWLDRLISLIFPENMYPLFPYPSHLLTPLHLYPDAFSLNFENIGEEHQHPISTPILGLNLV